MSHRSASVARAVNESFVGGTALADRIEAIQHALTVRQLTEILQCSDQTIYRMTSDQTIPFFMLRGSYRFDPRKIAEWLRERSMSA